MLERRSRNWRDLKILDVSQVLKELSMWELERRTNLFRHHWRAPYWPHDGAAKMKWVALEGTAYTRHPFIPESVDEGKIAVPWLKVDVAAWTSFPKEKLKLCIRSLDQDDVNIRCQI